MTNAPRVSADRLVKVVLMGSCGAGKSGVVKAVAAEHAQGAVRASELGEGKIFRTEFSWPPALADGRRLRVRLFGLSGQPVYNAVSELLLAGASGVVFVASLARDQESAVREAFRSLLFNAHHHGLDLTVLPVALHYHAPASARAFSPDEMDALLGIAPGSVPRFVTGPGPDARMRAAVEWVLGELAHGPGSRVVRMRRRRRRADAIQF